MSAKFLLKDIGDGIGYPFCIFDLSESIVYCNDEFERTLGVRDLKGLTLGSGFEPTEFSPIVPGIRECLAGGNPPVYTIRVEGFPVRYYQGIVKPIHQGGNLKFAVCTLADVTAKMDSLNLAEQSKEFYNRIFDDLPQAYFLIGDDFSILRSNDAACHLFKYKRNAFVGIKLATILAGANNESGIEIVGEFKTMAADPKQAFRAQEIRGVKSDASLFPIRLSIVPADLFGMRAYSVIILDLSEDRERERKNIEEEIKLQGSMRNEALGKLAGNLAHDMNNLLAVIGGFGELIADSVTADQKPALDEILRAVKKASSLTGRTLAYTGRQQMESKPIDLRNFLQLKESSWRDALGDSIQLQLEVGANPIWINADEKLLLQTLFSLLANSKEALYGKGEVKLDCRVTTLTAAFFSEHGVESKPDDYALISVHDNGPGISQDIAPKIFEPYFSTKDPQKSSGLGLAIVLGIVKQHGGFIFCESRPGEGTEMQVYIPLGGAGIENADEEEKLAAIRPQDYTILVVDDEPQIISILQAALTQTGFRVFSASNGKEALNWVQNHEGSLNLLISDVVMPEMSGIEMVQELLIDFPGLPVIFITGYSSQIIDKNPVLRHFKVIGKPFSTGEVIAAATAEIARRLQSHGVSHDAGPE